MNATISTETQRPDSLQGLVRLAQSEARRIRRTGGSKLMARRWERLGRRAAAWPAFLDRLEGSMNQWRLLAHEALQRGDETTAWEAEQQIKALEQTRDSELWQL